MARAGRRSRGRMSPASCFHSDGSLEPVSQCQHVESDVLSDDDKKLAEILFGLLKTATSQTVVKDFLRTKGIPIFRAKLGRSVRKADRAGAGRKENFGQGSP